MARRDDLLLGVDLGAGSLKASVVDAGGALLGEAAHPVETRSPRPGWSEQNPADWYRALCQAVPKALDAAGTRPGEIAALGVSAGAHIQVLLDADDQVIRPAIMWSDQRSAAESEALHARAGETIIATGFNKVNPTWTMAQLAWLKRHEPEAVARVRRLFLAKDYLRFCLTGDWHTDLSDAVGALLADAAAGTWSAELCALIDWPLETLPPIVPPTKLVGRVTAAAAADTGLAEGTPVVAGSNDTTVELFGAGGVRPGQGAVKLATAGVLYRVVDGPSVKPPVSCYPHVIPGLYYTATGTNSCASAHRWLRDTVFAAPGADPGADFARMDSMAGEAPPGSAGLLFHPYLQGERGPYWDPRLRADFIGLTLEHDGRHFARACYEGIAYSIRDLLESSDAGREDFEEILILGGGAKSALWRQIISDVLGLEISRPAHGDASFGAALLAGVGAGIFASPEDAAGRCAKVVDRVQPDETRHALYSELFSIYKEAQARLAPLNHKLHNLFADAGEIS